MKPTLREATVGWIADDVDDNARAELRTILVAAIAGDPAAADELADRMAGPLVFGTAGLRGPVRAGPNGMNRAVVVRTTAGVSSWLAAGGHRGGVVVVGRDARRGSAEFAADAASVLDAAGFQVRVLDRPLPTPVLAFAVRHLNAVAGIQITASHNPATDNGYKLYDGSGAQIIPPADAEIEAAIAQAPAAASVPRSPGWTTICDEILEPYLQRVTELPRGTARELKIVLTPLCGVGGAVATEALRRAGFTDIHVVTEQFTPDPSFGGLTFPNPEEHGACDRLLELASAAQADLAIAFDPDADRCALGIPSGDGYRMLWGDETGALLGEHVLSSMDRAEPLVATTIVSSSMLASIARAHTAHYAETLTGFKWLVRASDGSTDLVFAYEEALGLCVDPQTVRDKDGITAAVLAADLAAARKANGSSLQEMLDELAAAHGVHLTDQLSIRVGELDHITELMTRLRAHPPTELTGTPVDLDDLLPHADVLRFTGDGIRAIVRPSGTEPKLKVYLQIVRPVDAATSLDPTTATAQTALDALRDEVRSLLTRR
ncbi:phospho-sugar mutase [Haloechinothrix halophila]|uniref:phospho-sugar mutase n=1 Tax=Haloechinothrix halophila TaxID=1069073 RepID=UPI000406CDA9|nr:phospho-sugar mutase [Haloechinothrix halophila]